MGLVHRLRIAFLAVLSAAGIAHAAAPSPTRVASMPDAVRPASVPGDYVITPNGYFHPSCVVHLDEDDEITAGGDVLRPDGRSRKVGACAYPSFDASGRARTDVFYNGYIALSATDPDGTTNANQMKARWVVPSGPTNASGQTLYFFPGLEQAPNVITILQPVLAWNGFGDSAWTMTNWNCCKSGTTFHGNTIRVRTGDRIEGTMKGTCKNGQPCPTWRIVSTDVTTGQTTTFKTSSFGQAFNWWFGGAMETYGVNTCNQFPANGSITFDHINVYDVDFVQVTPVWFDHVDGSNAPSCGYAVNATTRKTVITFTP